MSFLDVNIQDGDILLIGKRLGSFYWIKDIVLAPWDLIRLRVPRLFGNFACSRIQQDTFSKWNHIEVMYTDSDSGNIMCIGAHPSGVLESVAKIAYTPEKYRLAILRPKRSVSDEDKAKVVAYAKKMIGVGYPFMNIFKLRWALMTGGLKKLNAMTANGSEFKPAICSQLVNDSWSKVFDVLPHVEDFPAPSSFYDSIELERIKVLL